jgi:hypothetical protein
MGHAETLYRPAENTARCVAERDDHDRTDLDKRKKTEKQARPDAEHHLFVHLDALEPKQRRCDTALAMDCLTMLKFDTHASPRKNGVPDCACRTAVVLIKRDNILETADAGCGAGYEGTAGDKVLQVHEIIPYGSA